MKRLRAPRAEALGAITAMLGVAFLVWLAYQVLAFHADLDAANQARDALARQVQQLGASPVAGPPGSRGAPGASVTGPSGPAGPVGAPGASGRPGKPGATGSPGPTGSPGAAGAQGPAGATGPQGPKGDTGDTGPAGPQGAAGPSCPDGYSLQAPSWDPNALVCERDDTAPSQPSPSPSAAGLIALDPRREH